MKSFKSKKQNMENIEQNNNKKDELLSLLKVTHFGIPEGYIEVKRYPLKPPFSYAVIAQNSTTTDFIYLVDEIPMNADENVLYERLKELLEIRLIAPDKDHQEEGFFKQLEQILSDSKEKFNAFSNTSIEKVKYYLGRNIAGYDIIDPLMYDPSIEDISCGGPMNPIYVWHRNFESIRTNIVFENDDVLNNFIMKMVHRSGKHVSAAFPVADISFPGNHRMAILYQKELTPKGTSFTIRKFKEEPYTIIDLINLDTVDVNIVAYLWLLLEHKMSIMVLGPTASGKTTLLNAIISLVNPTYKIFTIEDVAEINISHENWFALVSRTGFGLDNHGDIGLFDLIKAGVRHRPDYIIIGEIRGDEAYVMFQALATGHGGMCTMHADSADSAVKRLMQKPMNIPSSYIPLMNCVITVKRVMHKALLTQGGILSGTRRTTHVSEVLSETNINNIFNWDSSSNIFNGDIKKSTLFQKIADNTGLSVEDIIEEFNRRVLIIQWMVDENIHDYKKVGSIVSAYYKNPEATIRNITTTGA